MRQLSVEVQDTDLADFFSNNLLDGTMVVCEDHTPPNVYDFVTAPLSDDKLEALWEKIKEGLSKNKKLAAVTIVVCQGKYGWDDYHLLHHLNDETVLDNLLEISKDAEW
jgi:hypothetical protein